MKRMTHYALYWAVFAVSLTVVLRLAVTESSASAVFFGIICSTVIVALAAMFDRMDYGPRRF